MQLRTILRFGAFAAATVFGGFLTAPAWSRAVVIDVAAQSNALTPCSAFGDCRQLNLGQLNSGAVGSVNISPNGFIEFFDGRSAAHFSVGESATTYQVLSGYTISPTLGRIDFISFYAPGSSIAVLPSGNRPAADFQIQFRAINTRQPGTSSAYFNDLEIAFAYGDPVSGAGNRLAAGATIGYRGNTLGVQPAISTFGTPGLFAGFPAQREVANAGGLLLGQQATDSDFAFIVGNYPDTGFLTVLGLVNETFAPRFAATAAVPEPATWTMLLLGFGAVGAGLRRTSKGRGSAPQPS